MAIKFNYINIETKKAVAKIDVKFNITKRDIARIIAQYVSMKNGERITDFIKETTKKWTKANIEDLVRTTLWNSGFNFYDDATEEQYEKALEIVNSFWGTD